MYYITSLLNLLQLQLIVFSKSFMYLSQFLFFNICSEFMHIYLRLPVYTYNFALLKYFRNLFQLFTKDKYGRKANYKLCT